MIAKLFQTIAAPILSPLLKIVDDLIPDKDLANRLKAEFQNAMLTFDTKVVEAQMNIILAEARGGWLQRNWRPMLMMICILIIANNYILFPYGALFFPGKVAVLELPGPLWGLLTVGTGGYIAGRTIEKVKKKD
jgi:hypothetical protein